MKRLFICSVLLFLMSINSYGQGCSISFDKSPRLRGIYLGMSKTEVTKLFPKVNIPANDELGYTQISLSFFPLPDRYTSYGEDEAENSFDTRKLSQYVGWQTVIFEFIDDKVVSFRLTYDKSKTWNRFREFIKAFSEPLNLPDIWIDDDSSYSKYSYLNCNGFRIEARMTGNSNPEVYFVDLEAPKIIKQRKKSINIQKPFKP